MSVFSNSETSKPAVTFQKPSQIKSWFFAFRPKTLLVSFSPIFAGSILAHKEYPYLFSIKYSLFAIFSALCIQIGTNLFNDVLDFKKGTDNPNRLGPKRATQNGWIAPRQVTRGALFFFVLAILFGIPLVVQGGIPILILGLVSLLCGYLYTGGPYPLAYKGLGELFVLLFFGFAATCGIFFIQTHLVTLASVLAGAQIGFLACTLICINNFRDFENDKLCNKMTLSARFGKKFSRFEIAFFFFISYVIAVLQILENHQWNSLIVFAALPLAIKIVRYLRQNEPNENLNQFLGMASVHQILFTILFFR